jgi:hypothetical protein
MDIMDKELRDYRNHLILAEQKAQEDFDKAILTLSGGALGILFAFIKDIVDVGNFSEPLFLFLSWVAWGLSIISVLTSYFCSHLALRKAIKQVDDNKIYNERPGGLYDKFTAVLNGLGGILFLAGVILIICFISQNIPAGRKSIMTTKPTKKCATDGYNVPNPPPKSDKLEKGYRPPPPPPKPDKK